MVLVEKSFPRGGATEKETEAPAPKENIIFGALQKKLKKPKKKSKADQEHAATDDAEPDNLESISADLLSYSTIQDGMNIMGIVKTVDQLFLTISLPGRMLARVSALEISNAYTKITKEFLQQTDTSIGYKPLTDLYQVGQTVYGRVQEVKQNMHGRTSIVMSLRPSEVHSELLHAHVKKGFIFNGAIEEVQEHGYIIESGINRLRTFMPLDKSQSDHVVGELIFLKVEKLTTDQAASTCICKEIKVENMKIKNQVDPNIDYILPTTIVQFTVTKLLKDGLQGAIMNEAFTAYVNEHHLTEPLALPEDYELNATINARVLYVMPLTKLVYLTLNLRQAADEASSAALAPNYKRGDVVERAKVHHLGTGGVILILDNKYKGVLSYRTIKANFKGNYDQDEIIVKYAKKTAHKVRVLDYDPMDCLYVCTDDTAAVNEKVFTLDDVNAGDIVTAIVTARNAKVEGYNMQLGKVKGIIEKIYLAPNSKTMEENAKVRCRVVAVSTDRQTVYLTNRAEYMSKNCKIIASLANARVNGTFMGTIVKCHQDYLLVKFFNQVKGILYRQRLNNFMGSERQNFYVGQTMAFRVENKNSEQLTLTLADDTFSLGEICPATVVNALDSGLEIKITYNGEGEADEDENAIEVKGLVPMRLLSDHMDLLRAKLNMYASDTQMQAVCIMQNIFSIRDVAYFQSHLTNNWQNLKAGDVLKACVKNVTSDVVELFVPIRNYGRLVKVHMKMLLVGAFRNPEIMLSPDQVVYVKVLSKELNTKTITVTAKLTDIWDGDFKSTAAYTECYLREIAEIKKAFKRLGRPIAQHSIGEKVTAYFRGVHADSNDWQFEVANTKVTAIAKPSIVGKSKIPKVGESQECIILWIDYSSELVFVSNRPGDLAHINSDKKIPPNLVGKSGINAKVLLKVDNLFICSLKKGQNPLVYCPLRLHFNDFENSASADVKEGEFCKLAFIHETRSIAVLESTWKLWSDIKRKRKANIDVNTEKPKKAKKSKETAEHVDGGERENAIQTARKIKEKWDGKAVNETAPKKKKLQSDDIITSAVLPFYEDKTPSHTIATISNIATVKTTTKKTNDNAAEKTLPPSVGDFWSTDLTKLNADKNDIASSDDDDDDDDDAAAANAASQNKKKLTATEKFKRQREEELRLREIETKYADPNHLPENVDQFDRLVLSEPDNSKHWINYMVYHLQSTEVDKARAVARRAIKTISYRDNNEQLNIWVALLNLELRYGTKETFDETLKEAITYNDPQKVYMRAVEILCDAKKTQELIELLNVITKKFKAQPEVWRTAANAYFSIGMAERAQQLLHKALVCLPEREHVNTIVAFGNLNHKYGNNEMAQTLLDQVVTSYPKRVDVWTQYVDMLVKENLIDSARTVLQRAIIQQIPIKKMRTIFKKYLEFEERFGTEADVEKVKNLATDYVKKNTHL